MSCKNEPWLCMSYFCRIAAENAAAFNSFFSSFLWSIKYNPLSWRNPLSKKEVVTQKHSGQSLLRIGEIWHTEYTGTSWVIYCKIRTGLSLCQGRGYVMDDQSNFFQFSTGNRDVSFSAALRMGLRPSQHHSQWVLWVFPCA